MYLSALAASAFALHASAFLVPLEISTAAEQAKSDLTSFFASAPNTIQLDCPGCPFFGIEDTAQVQANVENKLLLEFGVDATGSLTINKQSILPPSSSNAPPSFVLAAPQIRLEDGQMTRPIQLDFAWESLQPITSEANPDLSILPFQFTILGLQGYPVKVDTVSVHLLRSPGQTSIAKISKISFKDTPGAMTCDTSSKWSICRLRAIIAARIQAMFEAAKARAHTAKGWIKGQGKGCRGKFGHRGGHKGGPPGMHHEHGQAAQDGQHHHQHHRAHRFGRLLYQTLRFVVIPALLGVIGGLMASAIGMLAGQFIAFLWIRYHRGGRRGTVRAVEIIIEDDEKDALIVNEEVAPPQYEDIEVAVVEDEKK